MITSSGRSSSTSCTASAPSPASPSTTRPGVLHRAPQRLAQQLVVVGDQYGGHLGTSNSTDTRAPWPGCAVDDEVRAEGVGAFAHPDEAVVVAGDERRVEAAAVVLDDQA